MSDNYNRIFSDVLEAMDERGSFEGMDFRWLKRVLQDAAIHVAQLERTVIDTALERTQSNDQLRHADETTDALTSTISDLYHQKTVLESQVEEMQRKVNELHEEVIERRARIDDLLQEFELLKASGDLSESAKEVVERALRDEYFPYSGDKNPPVNADRNSGQNPPPSGPGSMSDMLNGLMANATFPTTG